MKSKKPVEGTTNGKRKRWSAAEKLRIVLAGMEPGVEISDLCRREGVNPTMYYQWKRQLLGAAALLIASQLIKLMAPWAAARAIDTLQHGGAGAVAQAGLWVLAIVLISVGAWTLHGPGRVLERNVGVRVRHRDLAHDDARAAPPAARLPGAAAARRAGPRARVLERGAGARPERDAGLLP